jgi:hypothetical protein
MKKSYRLVLEVDLDEADEPNAVRVARRQPYSGVTCNLATVKTTVTAML